MNKEKVKKMKEVLKIFEERVKENEDLKKELLLNQEICENDLEKYISDVNFCTKEITTLLEENIDLNM
jgi:hypothetical protein